MSEGGVYWLQVLGVVFGGISALLLPVFALFMKMAEAQRRIMISRLDHADECMEDLKRLVLGSSVTRGDLEKFSAENALIMTRMREAISQETHGLHDRIMRLENQWFARTGHAPSREVGD